MNTKIISSPDRLAVGLYGLLLVYTLNLIVQTLDFSDPRARLFPLLFGVPTALILGLLTVRGLMPTRFDRVLPTRSVEEESETDDGELGWLTVVIFASFPFVAYLFGFLITVPVYTFALTSRACDDVRTGLAVAVVVTVGWWIVFVELLNVIFYEGILL
jgi:hypothetical protein